MFVDARLPRRVRGLPPVGRRHSRRAVAGAGRSGPSWRSGSTRSRAPSRRRAARRHRESRRWSRSTAASTAPACPAHEAGTVALAAARGGLGVRWRVHLPGPQLRAGRLDVRGGRRGRRARARRRPRVRAAGLDVRVLSGGSTPSLAASDLELLTEPAARRLRVRRRAAVGARRHARPGATSRSPAAPRSSVMPAAGWSSTRGARRSGRTGRRTPPAGAGSRRTTPRASSASPSTTRWSTWPEPTLPPLGRQVDVVPNHVCAAVNLHDTLWADRDGALVAWTVTARGPQLVTRSPTIWRMSSLKRPLAVLAVLASVSVLAGCGDDESAAPSTPAAGLLDPVGARGHRARSASSRRTRWARPRRSSPRRRGQRRAARCR